MFMIVTYSVFVNVAEDTSQPCYMGELACDIMNDDQIASDVADMLYEKFPEIQRVAPMNPVASSIHDGWCETWECNRKHEKWMLRRLRKKVSRSRQLSPGLATAVTDADPLLSDRIR